MRISLAEFLYDTSYTSEESSNLRLNGYGNTITNSFCGFSLIDKIQLNKKIGENLAWPYRSIAKRIVHTAQMTEIVLVKPPFFFNLLEFTVDESIYSLRAERFFVTNSVHLLGLLKKCQFITSITPASILETASLYLSFCI